MTLRLGTAGWSYTDWAGIVYPHPRPKGFDELSFLSEHFSVLEINSTFYHPPSARTAQSWVRRVSAHPQFRFTAKLWGRFTHQNEPLQPDDVQIFLQGIQPLADAGLLGALLVQFPWSFRKGKAEGIRLLRLIEAFRICPLVLEVRHSSWNDEAVFEFLKKYKVGFCNIDQPIMDASLTPSSQVTSPIGYFRLHGRNYQNWFRENAGRNQRYDYLYDQKELESLAGLIQKIIQQAEDTYVIANNHFRGQAACNALELQKILTGSQPPIPSSLQQHYPRLTHSGGVQMVIGDR